MSPRAVCRPDDGAAVRARPRAGVWLAVLVASFFAVSVGQTQDVAYALAVPPIIPNLPAGLLTGGAGEGGAVVAVAAGEAAPLVIPGTIVAGAVISAGAVSYGTYKAVTWLWNWSSAHSSTYADSSGTQQGGVNPGGTCVGQYGVTCSGNSFNFGNGKTVTVTMSGGVKVGSTTGTIYVQGDLNGSTIGWQRVYAPYSEYPPPYCNSGTFTAGSHLCTFQVSGHTVTTTGVQFQDVDGYVLGQYNFLGSSATAPSDPVSYAPGTTPVTTTPTSQCSNGSSYPGTPVTYTGNTTTPPALTLPACPAGTTRVGWSFPSTTPNGPTTPPFPAQSPPVVPSGFPDCQSPGSCTLVLYRVGHGTAAQSYSCGGNTGCAGWQTMPRTGPTGTVRRISDGTAIPERARQFPNGDTLECNWGPYVLEVDGCAPVPTEPSPGAPTPAPDEAACYPTGWAAFNPLEWVYKPVKCVLVWAFVPSQSSVNGDLDRVKTALDGSAVKSVYTGVTGVVGPFTQLGLGGSGDCHGPQVTLTVPVAGDTTGYPFDTCGRLPQMVLGVLLPIETFAVYAAALFGGARILSRTVGAESI